MKILQVAALVNETVSPFLKRHAFKKNKNRKNIGEFLINFYFYSGMAVICPMKADVG